MTNTDRRTSAPSNSSKPILDEQEQEHAQSPVRNREERKSIREATRLSARLVYEVIRQDGKEELARPASSLMWSGIAGGIMISFSIVAMSLFRYHLPDTEWRPLVEGFGYSFGFLLVILGRLQLFTENTITTVVPLYKSFSWFGLSRVLRLWVIVFLANMLGAIVAAAFLYYSSALPVEVKHVINEISLHTVERGVMETFLTAIPAGILIAALVWILPSTNSSFLAIVFFTYLIALGDFSHVIAGSVEAFYLVFSQAARGDEVIMFFIVPALAGNIVGGTAIFTLMVWGQVKDEQSEGERSSITHARGDRQIS